MKGRFIALVTALIITPALLFAVPVVVTWDWMLDDPEVTHFRYQLDGEDADGWTVVDAMVTSFTAEDLDGSVEHVFYLQQSYDGVNFGESAVSVAEPLDVGEIMLGEVYEEELFFEEEIFVAEDFVDEDIVEEEVVVADVTPIVAEEEAVAVVATTVKEKARNSGYYTTITLGGSVSNNFHKPMATYHGYNASIGLGVNLNNIIAFNRAIGMGLSIEGNYAPQMKSASPYGWKNAWDYLKKFDLKGAFSGMDHAMDFSAALMMNMNSKRIAFDIGAGGFLLWGPKLVTDDGNTIRAGAVAKASLSYRFTPLFSMGVSGRYGVVLSEGINGKFSDLPMFADGRLFLGFSF